MSSIKYQEPTNATEPKVGDLRVWWNPQIGGRVPQIHFPVATVYEGQRLLDALARYDLFQLEHRVKGDYANVGGLEEFVEHAYDEATDGTKPGWNSWEYEDEEHYIESPREYVEKFPEIMQVRVALHSPQVHWWKSATEVGVPGTELFVTGTLRAENGLHVLLQPKV